MVKVWFGVWCLTPLWKNIVENGVKHHKPSQTFTVELRIGLICQFTEFPTPKWWGQTFQIFVRTKFDIYVFM
jgi:hypothetical protein